MGIQEYILVFKIMSSKGKLGDIMIVTKCSGFDECSALHYGAVLAGHSSMSTIAESVMAKALRTGSASHSCVRKGMCLSCVYKTASQHSCRVYV